MPGTPKGARLSMRFRVQYRDADGDWIDVEDADSGWRNVGTREGRAGRVRLELHVRAARRSPVTLRGVVRFRWRRGDTLPRAGRGRHGGRPPLQRGRRPGRLLRRDLRAR